MATDGYVLAARHEPDQGTLEDSFYFINDTDIPIDELYLDQVGYEWGDAVNARKVGKNLGAVNARQYVLAWRDDSDAAEVRMDLALRVRTSRGEAALNFEIPKLYRRGDGDSAPLLGTVRHATDAAPMAALEWHPPTEPTPEIPPVRVPARVRAGNDFAVEQKLLDYVLPGKGVPFQKRAPDPAVASLSLTRDLSCDALNLAEVILDYCHKLKLDTERAMNYMDAHPPAPDMRGVIKGIFWLYEECEGLTRDKCHDLLRTGRDGHGTSEFGAPYVETVGDLIEYLRGLEGYCRK